MIFSNRSQDLFCSGWLYANHDTTGGREKVKDPPHSHAGDVPQNSYGERAREDCARAARPAHRDENPLAARKRSSRGPRLR